MVVALVSFVFSDQKNLRPDHSFVTWLHMDCIGRGEYFPASVVQLSELNHGSEVGRLSDVGGIFKGHNFSCHGELLM